ncbi:ABC transporter ATP-binding protein [Rhodoligotrophos defluvii]|uniref:ABC transporter ATP-binding protein n=1 Tax=Rhodoligotrophos defluvii TaxID=2561934 RepID=UPI0010C962BB|nr:ABC transporter ATP-binding protein [Rhodoligotrophos defluvii]
MVQAQSYAKTQRDPVPAPEPDILVRFTGVEKTYDGITLVIQDLNLDVQKGEFLTLLGPSGSGKTTALMMLAGFELPTRGTISIAGEDITRVPPYKRGIGVVFQNYALFPHMTVAENLAFPLSVRGIGQRERTERVANALDMVRLSDLGGRMPQQLSGGQQQRIALARALIFEPKLVLMDEPLGALDKQLREHMQYEIKSLHDRLGVTVIYVTHDQGEALTMSDRVAVFNEGRIQQIASPREIYERPISAFVAQFIGENNKIDATLDSVQSGRGVAVTRAGHRIICDPAPGLARGDHVLVSIRPEAIFLADQDAGFDNEMDATVTGVIYHGDHVRLQLDAANGQELVVKAPVRHAQGTTLGMKVRLGWNARDARALAAA